MKSNLDFLFNVCYSCSSSHSASSSSNEQQQSQPSSLPNDLTEFLSSQRNSNSDPDNWSKVSTDSAFQSLGDGLELEDNDAKFSEDSSAKLAMDSNGGEEFTG